MDKQRKGFVLGKRKKNPARVPAVAWAPEERPEPFGYSRSHQCRGRCSILNTVLGQQ
jgi:hypothetical protein